MLAALLLLFIFNGEATAQNPNVSYNLNSIPVTGSTDNSAFGFKTLFSNTTGTSNTATGSNALFSNTTGSANLANGVDALRSNTTGGWNTATGGNALYYNTGGSYNTAAGLNSIVYNTSGSNNTASGYNSLYSNSSGNNNTSLGMQSLFSNTTGNYNTGIGYNANVASGALTNATAIGNSAIVNFSNSIQLGNSNVTQVFAGTGTTAKFISGGLQVTGGTLGSGRILTSDAVGNATWQLPASIANSWNLIGNAGTSSSTNFIGTTDNVPLNFRVNNLKAGRIDHILNNVFLGMNAGVNTTGGTNCFIGTDAGAMNTTGYENTAVGYQTLQNNTIGNGNVAIGINALQNNTTGWVNVGLGYFALNQNISGLGNLAIGSGALFENINGNLNFGLGNSSLYNNISGIGNVAVGAGSLFINSTGNYNIGIGIGTDLAASNLQNATAIGYNTIVNASNKIRLGSGTVTVVEGPVLYTVSDKRFKYNVSETDMRGLGFIKRLRPVVYNFDTKKFQEFLVQEMPDSMRKKHIDNIDFQPSSNIRQSGFIAQEVETAAKEAGYDFNGLHIPESEVDNYSLSYSQFVVPLVKAVQELSAQNDLLKKEIEELKLLFRNNSSNTIQGSIKIDGSGSGALLFQNAPNPFNKSTVIKYFIPADAKKAAISVLTAEGKKIKEYNIAISGGSQSITIDGGQLTAGVYFYSLIIEDVVVDSKQMILTH